MSDPFGASYLKIERAKTHVQELEAVVKIYLDGGPVSVVTEVQERGVSFQMKFQGVPMVTSAIVGDIFHNADSDRYRPPFRFDAAHDSGMIPPTVPG
jgi:hypothetical protein